MDYIENLFKDTFADFEDVFVIKTFIGSINKNFLCLKNLEEIADLAYELGFEDLPRGDEIEGMYNSQYDDIVDIFEKWDELFNKKYLALKKDLFSLAINGENAN